jgi:hypothetical protein
MAEGSRRRLSFVAEVTPGTSPVTGWQILRCTGDGSITDARQAINSNEFRSDRGVGTPRHGNSAPQVNIPVEFSYGTYDSLLESAMQGAWTVNVLKQGATKKYLSIEEGFLDMGTPQYQVIKGALCSGFDLSIAPNAMVTGNFRFVGLDAAALSATAVQTAAHTAATTTAPFDSFTGSISEGGSGSTIITSLTMTLDNGVSQLYSLFSNDPNRIVSGRANLSGSMSLFFDSATLLNKFLNETETSIAFTLTDLAGNDYIFSIPKVKYMGGTKDVTENNIVLNLPWQAYYDTSTTTTFQITRTPA